MVVYGLFVELSVLKHAKTSIDHALTRNAKRDVFVRGISYSMVPSVLMSPPVHAITMVGIINPGTLLPWTVMPGKETY